MSIGIRSGVNWMRLNFKRHRFRQLADQQRLGQPRHAHQQGVAPGEQADRQPLDHVLLADDHAAQLAFQLRVNLAQAVNRRDVVLLELLARACLKAPSFPLLSGFRPH